MSEKMEIYIIRHGETVWNALGKMQGCTDIELNENGRELAGRLGERLEDVSFDAIYSSPLIRAYETACLIRGHRNIPIIRDDRLREITFGVMEGTHFEDWLNGENRYRWFFTDPGKYQPPAEGEELTHVIERTADFLKEIVESKWQEKERIMIVAHGALNKGLMCRMEGNTVETYWGDGLQRNCEATIFEYDGSSYRLIK